MRISSLLFVGLFSFAPLAHAQPASCGSPPPADCVVACPTGATVTHLNTVTGAGIGTSYGERFLYTLTPAANSYCADVREVVTTAGGNDGCNCTLPATVTINANPCCTGGAFSDTITNTVNNPGTPCPCATTSTQQLQCRAKDSSDAWVTFHTNTLTWERLANADIRATSTPAGGAAVTHTQAGPAKAATRRGCGEG